MKHLVRFLAPFAAAAVVACADAPSGPNGIDPNAPPSVAFLVWNPMTGAGDSCPVDVHNRYATMGPDGKIYPTWHPPVDPETGCTFGHEHGRDPRGSDLYRDVGDIPFGYANETLDIWDPSGRRHEDHVGHKVEWENDVQMNLDGIANQVLNLRCDILTKLHQGTHSKDAFTNNLHELVYHIKCTDGTQIHMTVMSAIGRAGEFTRSCEDVAVQAGTPTPANSPDGGGHRKIPDRTCVNRFVLVNGGNSNFSSGIHESWQTSNSLRRENGKTIVSIDPYFQVKQPSRFHDPGVADITGRVVNLCYEVEANGDRARGGGCASATSNGTLAGIVQTDPRSPFNGVSRFVDINGNRVDNADGPEVWYTDPFGKHGKPEKFPGSIRQVVSRTNNSAVPFHGPRIGESRNYGGTGVHAPN
ncbi:MAG: hypothetical protein HOP28_05830 [Gemmatimonadales bacterium]|nr:hypothetical protein [Gemmatimonadales bacterium]